MRKALSVKKQRKVDNKLSRQKVPRVSFEKLEIYTNPAPHSQMFSAPHSSDGRTFFQPTASREKKRFRWQNVELKSLRIWNSICVNEQMRLGNFAISNLCSKNWRLWKLRSRHFNGRFYECFIKRREREISERRKVFREKDLWKSFAR